MMIDLDQGNVEYHFLFMMMKIVTMKMMMIVGLDQGYRASLHVDDDNNDDDDNEYDDDCGPGPRRYRASLPCQQSCQIWDGGGEVTTNQSGQVNSKSCLMVVMSEMKIIIFNFSINGRGVMVFPTLFGNGNGVMVFPPYLVMVMVKWFPHPIW